MVRAANISRIGQGETTNVSAAVREKNIFEGPVFKGC